MFLVLIAYLALALAYSLFSPIYEPTDELRHFRYVRHIIAYRELPVQSVEGPRAQSHHPPLYYVLGALASWWVDVEQDVYYDPPTNPHWDSRHWEVSDDNKNQYLHGADEGFPFHGVTLAVYVVRWMTVLIGAGVVCLTYCIGREIFPRRPALAAGAAALIAFNPQFIYLSGAINNDIAAALAGTAVLWACVRLVRRGPSWRADVVMGVLYGLALLTKFNLLALLALIELAYVLAVWRTRPGERSRTRPWRAFLRGNLIVLGPAALIAGWWFVRNQVLYGDPAGLSILNELWAGRTFSEGLWAIPQGLPYLWSSVWGRFGYGQLPLPEVVYQGLFWFCAAALAGLLAARRRDVSLAVMALLAANVLIFTAWVLYYIAIQPAGAMGRFLFPCLPAFALLVVWGLSRFLPDHWDWLAGAVVAVGMAALAVYALAGVLAPAFSRPRPLTEAEVAVIPNSMDVDFAGVVRLLGYEIDPTAVEPGGTVEVTVYWQALARTDLHHAIFVHLLSDTGVMVAQRDTYPGLGRYPSTAWEPSVVFADTYRVHIPETAYAPDVGYIQVGIYAIAPPENPRLITSDGRNAVRLAAVEVLPLVGEFPNSLEANFGGKAALVGYELDRRTARPGEAIRLTLYWRALALFERNYGVFAHVLGEDDQRWAWSDGWPVQGNAPTRTWEPGQIIEDVHELKIGETTPPGFYDIEVGMSAKDVGRLPVVAEDGHQLGNRVLLCKIRVIDETDQE
ncbi:MAG: glycosyltransferase family 39 protein [Anaerolineae bacterium]|nr:glycosyltransferase family 39 protein [Anaerolineae bacterium]